MTAFSLTHGLHRAARLTPKRLATVCLDRRRTYEEHLSRVARLAGALQAMGVAHGDRVGMLAQNSDRYLEYYFGVWWAGAVVNAVNTRWSAAEVAYSFEDCGTGVLLVDDAFATMVAELRKQSKALKTVIYTGDGATPAGMLSYEKLLADAQPAEDAGRSGDDVAGVFYTGGTTGFPKGVMLTHQNLCSCAMTGLAEGLVKDDSIALHAAPMFHLADGALTTMVTLRGGTHVVAPVFKPELILKTLADEGIETALLVPTMIQMLVDHPGIGDYKLDKLEQLMYGASPISEALLDRAMAKLPGVAFSQVYGMTEVSAIGTVLPARFHTAEGRKLGKLRSAGRPTFNMQIKIVDTDDKEVPRGTVGEIALRGPGVMKGYWNQPEQSATALRGGWMHSGDGAYMDEDGFVFIVDRLKDMIVTGGENVYSAEVENAISRHPAVAMSAVIGIPSDQWGEAVHAVIVLKAGQQANADDIKAHCKTLVAGYKCPRSIDFREALPISGAGKILKNKLREPFWEGHERRVG